MICNMNWCEALFTSFGILFFLSLLIGFMYAAIKLILLLEPITLLVGASILAVWIILAVIIKRYA